MPKLATIGWIGAAACVAFATWLFGGWGGEATVRVVDQVGLVGFATFATVCAGLAARSASGRQRIAWIWLTFGLAGWTVGEVIWAYFSLVLGMEKTPFPSVADVAYLLFPVGACVALVLFPAGYASQSRIRLALDGLIVGGALFAVSWAILLQDVYEAGELTRFAFGVSLAYPVTDVVVLAVALLVLARGRTSQRTTLLLLTAGCASNALSDSAFVYLNATGAYFAGSTIDVGWVAALFLLSMAALVSRRAAQTEEFKPQLPSRASIWLPYLPLAVSTVVCALEYSSMAGLGFMVVLSSVLMAMVMARQFVVVSENRRLLELVSDQALRDPLTGLANRALFNDRLSHAVQLHRHDRQSVTVLLLDLDDFKLVNDSFGHLAGDTLLALIAERLLTSVRTSDTVARLGGDEFAVLVEGRPEHAHAIAERIIQTFDVPFVVDGHDLSIRPSVGLAVSSISDDDCADVLLKQADVAMYSAKRARTGDLHVFTPGMHLVAPNEFDSSLEPNGSAGHRAPVAVRMLGELRTAINDVGLKVVYQPKFDLRDELLVGVEALVRWPHPERGLLGPDQFLHLVRQHDLMRSVTTCVLRQALDDAAKWHARGVGIPIAVNLFAPSLEDLNLPSQLAREMGDRNLSMDILTVEITEDVLVDSMDLTRTVLNRLREDGIRVAIDDFGSGYNALRYLRELPIDEVKLDKQFIGPILVDRRAASIVRAVIDLAHVLGLTTVAEGVEDAQTAARLREYGCEEAQGYYYSPPISAADMLQLLLSPRSWPAPFAARSS